MNWWEEIELHVQPTFNAGDTLSLYSGVTSDSGSPRPQSLTPLAEKVVDAAGNVTFTGLTEGQSYVAGKLVAGHFRFIYFAIPKRDADKVELDGLTQKVSTKADLDKAGGHLVDAQVPIAVAEGITEVTSAIYEGALAAVVIPDATINPASKNVESPGGHFTPAMNGQYFYLRHAGPILTTEGSAWKASPLVGQFLYVSPTHGTLSVETTTAVAAGEMLVGPDAGPAIEKAVQRGVGMLPANTAFIVATEIKVGSNQSLTGQGTTSRLFSVTPKGNVVTSAVTTNARLKAFDVHGNGWGGQPANVDPGAGKAPNFAEAGCGVIFAQTTQGRIRDVNTYHCAGDGLTAGRNGVAGIWLTMGATGTIVRDCHAAYCRAAHNEDNYYGAAEDKYPPTNNSWNDCSGENCRYGFAADCGANQRGGCASRYVGRFNVISGVEIHRSQKYAVVSPRAEFNGRTANAAPGIYIHGDLGASSCDGVTVTAPYSYGNGTHGIKVSERAHNCTIYGGEVAQNEVHGIFFANESSGRVIGTTSRNNANSLGEYDGVSVLNCPDGVEFLGRSYDDRAGGKASQNYGFRSVNSDNCVVVDGCIFSGNTKGSVQLQGANDRVGAKTRESILAAAEGFKGQTFNRALNGGNVLLSTKKGRGTLASFRAGEKITSLYVQVDVKGAALTKVELALCKPNGTVVGKTADVHAAFEALGVIGGALEAPIYIPEDGVYYLVIFAAGTTPPSIAVGTTGTTGYTAQVLGEAPPNSAVENTEHEALSFATRAGTGTAPWFAWA